MQAPMEALENGKTAKQKTKAKGRGQRAKQNTKAKATVNAKTRRHEEDGL
jgi:hypothetical protein